MSNSSPIYVIAFILAILGMGLTACSSSPAVQEPPKRAETALEKANTETPRKPSATPVAALEKANTKTPREPSATALTATEETHPEFARILASLSDLGPAPDFANEVWINTDTALTLEALRGRVVLVEFWTFG